MGHSQPLFFFIFIFSIQLNVSKCSIQICLWLDSNREPLVLEATALPTEPLPLPNGFNYLVIVEKNVEMLLLCMCLYDVSTSLSDASNVLKCRQTDAYNVDSITFSVSTKRRWECRLNATTQVTSKLSLWTSTKSLEKNVLTNDVSSRCMSWLRRRATNMSFWLKTVVTNNRLFRTRVRDVREGASYGDPKGMTFRPLFTLFSSFQYTSWE